ncbi:MAG TPA: TolC family protein [Gemmatimonadales bacterium]|jgi:outer membrane protein
MRSRLLLVALASLAVAVRPAAAQQTRTVTLADAIRLSVQLQPSMVGAEQNVRLAEMQYRQTEAAFLPSLSTSLTTSRSGGSRASQFGVPTNVEAFYSSRLGITANWDLFTGFRRGYQRRMAGATTDQREATLHGQQYATILATEQAFYLALADSELVGVAASQLRAADEQLKLTSERLRLGATTRSDSLRASVAYGTAEVALITAQSNLKFAQATLARAIQVDGFVTPVSDTMLFARVPNLDTAALMREALEGAPTVLQATANTAIARAGKGVSRAAWLPTVSLALGNTWLAGNGTTVIRDANTNAIIDTLGPTNVPFGGNYLAGWNVSLSVSYPLFNNLTRETNSVSSDVTFQTAVAAERDARLAVSTTLTEYFAALQSAQARIDVGVVNVAAATEDLRMQTERYRLGAATILDVLTSQATLDQARVSLVQARYDYLTARAEIEAVLGRSL